MIREPEPAITSLQEFEKALLDKSLMRIVSENPVAVLSTLVKLFSRGNRELVIQKIEPNHQFNLNHPLVMNGVGEELGRTLVLQVRELYLDKLRPHSRIALRKRQEQ